MSIRSYTKGVAALACAGAIGLFTLSGFSQGTAAQPSQAANPSAIEQGVDLARQTVQAGGEATVEVGSALKSGGQSTITQGRKLWQEAVLPAVQRTAASIPMLLKGILLLVAFWLAGVIAGAGVRRLLDMTSIDERAIKDWGLEGMLKRSDGTTRSLSCLLGATIKWILLLFGFVAFFNAINLTLVAAPLQRVLDSIVGITPQLLKATVILLVYWAIATVVSVALTRLLQKFKFDERAMRRSADTAAEGGTEKPAPSAMLGRLAFYLILLFGLPPFLQALGQDAIVAPLQDMLAKALSFLPNLVAAGIIVLVGRIVASIVREFVSNLLSAAGLDNRAEKLGLSKALGKQTLSSVVAQIAYFFILIPIVVAAVDSLGVKLIADPIKATLQNILAAVPAILVATIVIVIGCVVAKVVRGLVSSLLSGIGFDALPERIGLSFLTPKKDQMPLSGVLGSIVSIIIILITAQQAAAALNFDQLADLIQRLIVYLPDLAIGLVIMIATLSLAKYVANLVTNALKDQPYASLLAKVARTAIILLGFGMALEQLGIGEDIVVVAVTAVLGGIALAIGLAFGLGGRDRAKEIIDRHSR